MTWEHYRTLITVKDEKKRKDLEAKAVRGEWNSKKLRSYVSLKRETPVPKLTFTPGRLHTYQVITASEPSTGKEALALDLGFRLKYFLPKKASVKEGDMVTYDFDQELTKVTAAKEELFTYSARLDKVTDGDTLLVSFGFGLNFFISQKLRLRAIDCPEMDTDEGKAAKRFVESRLKDCEFIIVKTYKDRSDKYDRYLADVFVPRPSTINSDKAVNVPRAPQERKGITTHPEDVVYLNQQLLDERLAVKWV